MSLFRLFIGVIMGLTVWTVMAQAGDTRYELTIERRPVDIAGRTTNKITINGTLPGPTLRFTEGDQAVIHVTNRLDETTSVHWHGFLLPEDMDGAPGFGGFQGIRPGGTFTYRFPIRQNGTYWYHAHSGGQEQDGHYGGIVIHPQDPDPVRADREHVVLISDYKHEDAPRIMANLKMDPEYYQYARRTVSDVIADVSAMGLVEAWREARMWGQMRMLKTDLSDVTYDAFLVNGRTPDQNWTGLFAPGERVRLRFINASAMTIYDVRIPGLEMTVVAADGQNVEPVAVDEFRFGVAETYDVIVTPPDESAYTIVAEPIDRAGFALGTLAPREGMRGPAPAQRPRALLTMADMGMDHAAHGEPKMDHADHHQSGPSAHAAMGHGRPMAPPAGDLETGVPGSGWARSAAPAGTRILAYRDLRYLGTQKDTRPPGRDIELRLGGNMERYIWTINGKKFSEAEPIHLDYGERVRLRFVNETMMAHPMHLHGMFVQLENGQPLEKLPNKHVVIVAPGDTYTALLTADEPGEWAFHCHMIFHMKAGMMTKVVVTKTESRGTHPHGHHVLPTGSAPAAEVTREAALAMKEHGGGIFHAFQVEAGGGLRDSDTTLDWDVHGWIGGDTHKLVLKSEGERTDGETEQAELWALYSRNVATFWDAQVGVRHDLEPTSLTYLAVGVEGLAPFFIETEAHLFVSEDGDVSLRLGLEKDLLLTQRLIMQPYLEADLYAQDVPERDIGAGFANAGAGLQLRYEITRKLAPYIDLNYERKFGETAGNARRHGEDVETVAATVGLRVKF